MTNDQVKTLTSVSYDELVQDLIDQGQDVPLVSLVHTLESYGVEIYGPLRAYYPVDSFFIYDGLSPRAGAIVKRLVEDERLEVISSRGLSDLVVPSGIFELAEARRADGPRTEFTTETPAVGARDKQVLVRIRPKEGAAASKERLYGEQHEEGHDRVFVEHSFSEERIRRAGRR